MYKNESKHSEMGPVRQNPIQRTVGLFICVCIALCTIVAHNIAQNRPDNFPSYPPDDHHCSDDVYLREGGVSVMQQQRVKQHSQTDSHRTFDDNKSNIVIFTYSLLNTALLVMF